MNKEITILYVMDALRPDHLGCYGYSKPTSPFIDSLAQQSLLYRNIHAQATETKSSAATISTSTYASVHNTLTHADHLPTNLTTLASCLQEAGFVTAAFNTNLRLGDEFGFAQGFDYYFDLHKRPGFEDIESLPPSEMINDDIFSWLDSDDLKEAKKIFILAWAVDTHLPFTPPTEFKKNFFQPNEKMPTGTIEEVLEAKSESDYQRIISLYDAEIAHNDHNLKCLADGLNQRGLWDSATFLLTADHGETFMEHNQFLVHGSIPHKEISHVPLLLKSPTLTPGSSDRFGGLIDLMPTILTLNDIPLPETTQGKDLCGSSDQQLIFMESLLSYGNSSAVLTEQWRLVRWPSPVNLVLKKLNKKKGKPPSGPTNQPPPPKGGDTLPLASLKKVRRKRFLVDLIGTAPIMNWNLIAWFIEWIKYYIKSERLELYCRTEDEKELKNVSASYKKEIPRLLSLLNKHQQENIRLRQSLDLQQGQSAVSDEVTSRLQSLGYLE